MGSEQVLPRVDLWADVPFDHLPPALIQSFERKDWPAVRDELRQIMDGVVTDGVYGRELLKLVLKLPIGIDPLFDRYRAMTSLDFGDWDGLQRCLEARPVDPIEITGFRDIMLAPLSHLGIPRWTEPHHKFTFEMIELQFAQRIRDYRRILAEIQNFRPVELWTRGDIPVKRHVRYRQLHDATMLGVAEAHGGRLTVATAFAVEAQHLGDEGEPLRVVAGDLERLTAAAIGDAVPERLETWDMIRRPTGASPFGAWQCATYLLPLVLAARHPSLEWAAELAEQVAVGLGSPRAHFQAVAWKVAASLIARPNRSTRELPGLLDQARRASVGLAAFPHLLGAVVTQRHEQFVEAARLAREVGNVWVLVAALLWATALSPTRREGRRLHQLLEITGWRRAALVPPEVAAEAALGLLSLGIRGRSVLEIAAVAGRPNVTLEIARRHIEEPLVPVQHKLYALDVLAALGTTHAEEDLRRLASRRDEVGMRAHALLAKPTHPLGLSEREFEVLQMAGHGLRNREIGEKLGLSPHTIARHLANARTKLGAANRAEAATRLVGYVHSGERS